MSLKTGVSPTGIKPEMVLADSIVAEAFHRAGLECIRTSINDGVHGRGSLHAFGYAIDYRTKHVPDEDVVALADEIRANLGRLYDVILEDQGGSNEHLHVEWDPR